MARQAGGLHKGALDVEKMAEYKLPEQVVGMVGEWEKGTDVTRILWKHRQAVQGC